MFALGFALFGCDDVRMPRDGGPSVGPDAAPSDAGLTPPPPTGDSGMPGCVPACPGRECGADGCGGTCGGCADGVCRDGLCEASCPSNAEPRGDGCVCSAGFAPTVSCACEPDSNGDGCPAYASPSGGSCACDPGYRAEGCGCVMEEPACPSGETMWCGACAPDPEGDGCGPGFVFADDACRCPTGSLPSDDRCTCVDTGPDFTHPAFDPASCAGAPMTYAAARARWESGAGELSGYQMVFRQRRCDDDGCTAWEEKPLGEISWAPRASGVLRLVRRDGVVGLDLRNGLCEDDHHLSDTLYNVGAECTGIGATLTCSRYDRSRRCGTFSDTVYEFHGRELRFTGVLTETCARLQADVDPLVSDWEGQVAILAVF